MDVQVRRNGSRNDAPTVSVVIPAYNAAPYIAEALESVLSQTFTDHEIIVVNDGSPDTEEFERALEPYLDHVVYVTQENRGPASARNTGIREASGRFIALLDADDYFLPTYLAEQLAFIESGAGYDLVYSDALLFGDSPLAGLTYMQRVPSSGEVTFESLLALRCNIITSGVTARREPILNVGLFDEAHTQLVPAEDYDLWLRLACSGARLAYQRKVLLHHRIHPGSLSANSIRQFGSALQVLDKTGRSPDLTARERIALSNTVARLTAELDLEHGKLRLAEGNFEEAAQALDRASRFYRRWKLRLSDARNLYRSWKLPFASLCLRIAPRLLLSLYNLRRSSAAASSATGKSKTGASLLKVRDQRGRSFLG